MPADTFDFVIVGAGFGGSILSMILRRLGKTVLLVEQGSHPRFAIGESSTPFANLLLERIAEDYDLPFLRHFSEWGSWQQHFPYLGAGLKRGFTFYGHTPGEHINFANRATQLLVAASPNDRVADTHWYRPDFDHFLVEKAIELGVHYSAHSTVSHLVPSAHGWDITITTPQAQRLIKTGFIIDASGPGGALAKHLPIGAEDFPQMPPTSGVWAHFRNVPRLDQISPELRSAAPPYPPDDAAVHHVFSGGWIWVLRFNNGITSAGAAFTGAAGLGALTSAEEIWRAILAKTPTVAEQFAAAKTVTPFYHAKQLSFRRTRVIGPNWALLPSTVGFVDPLLSTGFSLTLLGIHRLAAVFRGSGSLEQYQNDTITELDAAADLVSALYAKMYRFEEFSLLTLLYFAAMSFTETAWRLGKQQLASTFLLTNAETFSANRRQLSDSARADKTISASDLERAITRYDVAGLTDWTRRNWYPVDFRDLLVNGRKLNASEAEFRCLFEKLNLPFPTSGPA